MGMPADVHGHVGRPLRGVTDGTAAGEGRPPLDGSLHGAAGPREGGPSREGGRHARPPVTHGGTRVGRWDVAARLIALLLAIAAAALSLGAEVALAEDGVDPAGTVPPYGQDVTVTPVWPGEGAEDFNWMSDAYPRPFVCIEQDVWSMKDPFTAKAEPMVGQPKYGNGGETYTQDDVEFMGLAQLWATQHGLATGSLPWTNAYTAAHWARQFGSGGQSNWQWNGGGTHESAAERWQATTGTPCTDYEAWFAQNRSRYKVEAFVLRPPSGLQAMAYFIVTPNAGRIQLQKVSADGSITDGNPCYTLEGATYGIFSDKGCTQRVATMTTGADGKATSGDLPAGTYWVKEQSPSGGYATDGRAHQVQVGGGATVEARVDERPQGAPVDLVVAKLDAETGQASPQGDGTLAGAEYAVAYYAGFYDEGSLPASATRTWTLKTDASGHASLAGAGGDPATYLAGGDPLYRDSQGRPILPLGTVVVRETKAPEGYLPSDQVSVVKVTSDGTAESVGTYNAPTSPEQVKRGGLAVGKAERESQTYHAQGGSSLEQAEFTIWNRSDHDVEVGGKPYASGEVVMVIATKQEEDGRWVARTGPRDLSFGTYEVRETKAPKGHNPDEAYDLTVEVREDGKVYDFTSPDASGEAGKAAQDQVWRQDFELSKRDESSMGPLVGVPFMVTSKTTGERHVIVTDENGGLSTAASWNPHTRRTNANDAAVTQDDGGAWHVDEGALDGDAGVWFSGYANGSDDAAKVKADDAHGALPYDSYTIEELPCSANRGRRLITFDADMLHDGRTADLGTLDDKRIAIGTTLTAEGSEKLVPAGGEVSLIDKVDYQGLEPGTDYRLVGTLHLVGEDGSDAGPLKDAEGKEVSAEATVSPALEDGSTTVDFHFDASGLDGRDLVAFEELYRGADLVASHADIKDEGQTVHVPKIGTKLADGAGSQETEATADLTLEDQVSYHNLVPGKEYVISGTLHLVGEDGSDEGEVKDPGGTVVTAQTTLTPQEASGTATVTFTFDASQLHGRSVVAFEDLSRGGRTYAVHADIGDENQRVDFPKIATSAADGDGNQESTTQEHATIVDTVAYENLASGQEYSLRGTLHLVGKDGADEGALVDGEGREVSVTVPLVPEDSSGTVEVAFEIDATKLQGRSLVAFEELLRGDAVVARHEDIGDTGQTVSFPQLRTTALGRESGAHELAAEAKATVRDTVTYEGLIPGHEYVVTGTLHLVGEGGEDAGPVKAADGSDATASVTFTPEAADGSVEVEIPFDASRLAGRSVVAFEDATYQGRTVAVHADIKDADQTVRVLPPSTPSGGTPSSGSGSRMPQTGVPVPPEAMAVSGMAVAGGAASWLAGGRRRAMRRRRR